MAKNHRQKKKAEYESRFNIISTQLTEGKLSIHVYASEKPDSWFEVLPPTLEDYYFFIMNQQKQTYEIYPTTKAPAAF